MAGDDVRLARHARHAALPQVGDAGLARIAAGSALMIGVGGIGCAAANYLAASGVGRLLLADFDTVDATNLGRQVLFGESDIGRLKAEVAAEKLAAINPHITIEPLTQRLTDDTLLQAVASVDVVLDGCDNFATRFQVSDACVSQNRCLIAGAAIRLEGQLAVFGPDYARTPCYRCLYQDADESLDNCAGNGVLGPVPGVIGTLMAVAAIKQLVSLELARGVLQLYDASNGEMQSVKIAKRPDCIGCASLI